MNKKDEEFVEALENATRAIYDLRFLASNPNGGIFDDMKRQIHPDLLMLLAQLHGYVQLMEATKLLKESA